MIRFIAALDIKNGIADEQGIPWQGKIPGDVAYFREKTINGVVMMGAGWYKEQQKPLPNRRNLVATSESREIRPGFKKVTDARMYLDKAEEDVWVGGGAGLFASTIDLANELYLTRIDKDFNCTKFFPEFDNRFELKQKSKDVIENGIKYHFEIWISKHD